MIYFESACTLAGRLLLGLYFIIPGIGKIRDFDGHIAYMTEHNVPFTEVLLVVALVIQLTAGTALIVGFKGKWAAFLLAGLTLAISLYIHNFWDYPEGMEQQHEGQNFFKNMGIMAGLLVIAGVGTGRVSLDSRIKQ